MTVHIHDIALVVGEELEYISRGSIEIDAGRITYAGEPKPPEPAQKKTMRLNGRGLLAIPGLIDAHTHLADSVAKDVGIGSKLDALVHPIHGLKTKLLSETPPAEVSRAMASTASNMLASGVTTFADFREGGLAGVQLARDALRPARLRALILGRPNQHFEREQVVETSAQLTLDATEELRQTLEEADGLGISGANEYTDGAMEQISNLTKAKQKLLGVHACESAESSQFSLDKFSKSEVERDLSHLKPDFLVHLTNARPKDLEKVSENRIPVVCCPRANSILGLGFPPILEMLDAGVTVALGTDNVTLASPDMFREMEFTSRIVRAIRREAGAITSKTVLKMATVNGAKALGLSTETGSIAQGKKADITFIDLNSPNLAFSRDVIGSVVHRARPEDVKCVMIDGEIAYGSIPSA